MPSCFQKNYYFLKAYLVLYPVNQTFNVWQRLGVKIYLCGELQDGRRKYESYTQHDG